MKKSVLTLLCLALLAFVGCTKEKAPTIKFITTGNYTNSTTKVYAGTEAIFGVQAVSNPLGKGISKIVVSYSNGDSDKVFSYDPVEDSPSNSWVKTFANPGKVTLTATAYDDNGETATATLTITVLDALHEPVIAFLSGETYVSDGMALYAETEYTFGVKVETDGDPQAPLIKRVDVQYSNENGIFNVYESTTGEAAIPVLTWRKTFALVGTITVTATVTDAQGTTASASINVIVTEAPGPDDNPFLGVYSCDNLHITGHCVAENIPILGTYDNDFNINLTQGSLVITKGASSDEVVVKMVIDGTEYNLNAVTNGNTINFEEKEMVIPMSINSMIQASLRATLDGAGNLNGNVLEYEGSIGENAYISVGSSIEYPGTITNGIMNGTFTKLTAK